MNNKKFFLRYFKGQWLSQNNLLLFEKGKQITNEQNIDLSKAYNNLYSSNKFFNTKNGIYHTISLPIINNGKKIYAFNKQSIYMNINCAQRYFFYSKNLRKGLIKIIKVNYKKRVMQYEYIYLVNHNLMISINLIKNFKGKYLGIKISSHIRKRINK